MILIVARDIVISVTCRPRRPRAAHWRGSAGGGGGGGGRGAAATHRFARPVIDRRIAGEVGEERGGEGGPWGATHALMMIVSNVLFICLSAVTNHFEPGMKLQEDTGQWTSLAKRQL